jgi:hypothetical protein
MISRTPFTAPHSSRTRGLAALVVMAFLGNSLAGYIHKAVERHARCPEHGEIIHVRGELAQTPADTAAAASPGSHARPVAPDENSHEHEHCYLCPSTRERLSTVSVASVVFDTGPTLARLAVPTQAEPARADIYIVAPKTSPPA